MKHFILFNRKRQAKYYNTLKKWTEWMGNLLENNYITCLTFEGINTVTEIWQQKNYIRERT